MTASNVGLKMMKEEALLKKTPLTQHFIRTLHKTLMREDYIVYRTLPGRVQTIYVIHAGQYKTRPNSVITRYGDRFEYATMYATLQVVLQSSYYVLWLFYKKSENEIVRLTQDITEKERSVEDLQTRLVESQGFYNIQI